MSGLKYEKLTREPVLERPIPQANPPVRLVKGARIRFAPGRPKTKPPRSSRIISWTSPRRPPSRCWRAASIRKSA